MDSKLLEKVGLTKGEAAAYLALLELGESTAGRVAKKAGVSGSKAYEILERLGAKGLAGSVSKSGRTFFSPSDPRVLRQLIAKKKKDVAEEEKAVEAILPSLMLQGQRRKPRHEATIYEGYDAVKNYYYRTLESEEGERLVFGARTGEPVSKSAQYFFRNYHKQRIRKGRRLRIIFNGELKRTEFSRDYEGMKMTKVRYLPQVTLSSVGIEGGCVDILIWTKETVVLFVIRSGEVAGTFRDYFELLWKGASA